MSKQKAEPKSKVTETENIPSTPEYFSNPVGFALDEANKWLSGEALDAPKPAAPVVTEVKPDAAERIPATSAAPASVVFNLGDVFRIRKPKSKADAAADNTDGAPAVAKPPKGKAAGVEDDADDATA